VALRKLVDYGAAYPQRLAGLRGGLRANLRTPSAFPFCQEGLRWVSNFWTRATPQFARGGCSCRQGLRIRQARLWFVLPRCILAAGHHVVGWLRAALLEVFFPLALGHSGASAVLLNEPSARHVFGWLVLLDESAVVKQITFQSHRCLLSQACPS
jgi:hypothetical protein